PNGIPFPDSSRPDTALARPPAPAMDKAYLRSSTVSNRKELAPTLDNGGIIAGIRDRSTVVDCRCSALIIINGSNTNRFFVVFERSGRRREAFRHHLVRIRAEALCCQDAVK